jgi:hypothetical protein
LFFEGDSSSVYLAKYEGIDMAVIQFKLGTSSVKVLKEAHMVIEVPMIAFH